MKRGPWQVLRALDRLANALLMGDGDQTLSARTGYAAHRGKRWGRALAPIIDAITFDKNHCFEAAKAEGLIDANSAAPAARPLQ